MGVLNHINLFTEIDSDVIDMFKYTAIDISENLQLIEKKDLTTTTYTDRTRLYNWWDGGGCKIVTPCGYTMQYMDFQNDINLEDFTYDGDGTKLVYDFLFTNHSVELPTIDNTDEESVALDILTSSMLSMYQEEIQRAYAYLSFYNQLSALYKDNKFMPHFDIRTNINRGIKPYVIGEE